MSRHKYTTVVPALRTASRWLLRSYWSMTSTCPLPRLVYHQYLYITNTCQGLGLGHYHLHYQVFFITSRLLVHYQFLSMTSSCPYQDLSMTSTCPLPSIEIDWYQKRCKKITDLKTHHWRQLHKHKASYHYQQ